MNHPCDPVKPCTTLGHIYSSSTVVRCPHRESWSVRVATWHDNDTDEPTLLFEAIREFGPFDGLDFVAGTVAELVALAMEHQSGFASL